MRSEFRGELTPFEIIVRMDGSAATAAALDWAAEQSRLTDVPMRITHTWHRHAPNGDTAAAAYWAASSADVRARVTRWVLDMLGGGADTVNWALNIVEGAPEAASLVPVDCAFVLVTGMRERIGHPFLVAV